MRRHLPLFLTFVLATGCVAKKRYTAELGDLTSELGATSSERDAASERAAAQEARAMSAEARAAELDRLAQDLEQRNSQLRERLAAFEQQLAEMTARGGQARAAKQELEALVASLQADVAEAEAEAKDSRARLEQLESEKQRLEAKTAAYDELVESLKGEIEAGQIQITELGGKLTVNLSNAILFDSGSYALRGAGEEALLKVATVLADVTDRDLRVEGHTDNVPVRAGAAYSDNWALSSLRASTVVALLVGAGVDGGNIQAVGYGEHHPLQSNETPEGRAANRRTEIVLAPRLGQLGAVEMEPAEQAPVE
jgi:chemotaxis protein MotB